jgi:hypothetical protein
MADAEGSVEESNPIASCEVDLSRHVDTTKAGRGASVLVLRHVQALVIWVENFHLPSLRRKSSNHSNGMMVHVTNPEPGKLLLNGFDAPTWEKSIHSALKKVICEDLGNMDATALLSTIPETDPEGRGMQEIEAMENKFSVKVVFDDETGHVFLVGESKKLEKKCFVLRNLLSHYHWRLSGRDVSFS